MNIGIDHGYHAIKTRNFSFPAGVTAYSHEPYTLQNTLQYGGKFYVCGTGRQPILRNKMRKFRRNQWRKRIPFRLCWCPAELLWLVRRDWPAGIYRR